MCRGSPVLADGRGAQDDIVMTVMLWRLDAGDIAGALEIAPYALKYGPPLTIAAPHLTCWLRKWHLPRSVCAMPVKSVDLSWLQTTIDLPTAT